LTSVLESRIELGAGAPLADSSRDQKDWHAAGCFLSQAERTAAVWRAFELEFGGADTVLATLSDGVQLIQVLVDVELVGRTAVLRGLHIDGGGRNTLGQRALRELVNWTKVQLDVDELRIEGATRTSGAGPGRIPPPIIF
jgi:hypothetical protein